MILKLKEITHSWGTERVLHLSTGSVVRVYLSPAKKKVTIQVAKEAEDCDVIKRWKAKYPSPSTTKTFSSEDEAADKSNALVHWFNEQ